MRMHWTGRNIKNYLFRIAADFIAQLEKKMESENISQDKLAERLRITKGRISQVLNHPANLTLESIVKYARTLGMKVSIVAYEDDDPQNKRGPINSEIFKICWEKSGKPRDFWPFEEITKSQEIAANIAPPPPIDLTTIKELSYFASNLRKAEWPDFKNQMIYWMASGTEKIQNKGHLIDSY
jgi:transcriptional regulator with XRE-family HTH domain